MWHPTIPNRADDVWRDDAGRVWHQYYNPDVPAWSAPERIGGDADRIAGDLLAAWRPDGRQYRVVGTGTDARRYEALFDPASGSWDGFRPVGP